LKCPETGRGATSYPIRHLKNRHFIDLNADHQALTLQPTSIFGTVAGAVAGTAASAATVWWAGMSGKGDFPTLFQYALDTLSCPAMSTECERVFSSAKKLITPERNQLGEDIIEACECLKGWWRNSLIEQQFGHFKKQKQ
jgi:hAT family C-terminal dimerisation region